MGLGLFIALSQSGHRIKSKKTAHENAKPRVIGRRKATGPPQADRRVARGALKAGLPGNGGTAFFCEICVFFWNRCSFSIGGGLQRRWNRALRP
jgi:hypothetical protein